LDPQELVDHSILLHVIAQLLILQCNLLVFALVSKFDATYQLRAELRKVASFTSLLEVLSSGPEMDHAARF
jgi:hypothetical protein